jgi:hypothetical protein
VLVSVYNFFAHPFGYSVDIKSHEKRYVIQAIPKWRHGNRKDIQAKSIIVAGSGTGSAPAEADHEKLALFTPCPVKFHTPDVSYLFGKNK